jgi:hypothetical protein
VAALAGQPGLTSVQPFHLVPRWSEQLAAFFNVVAMMGTASFTPLGARVRTGAAFGPCLVTSAADYRRAGGHEAAPAGVLDDVALAKTFERAGLPAQRPPSSPRGCRSVGWRPATSPSPSSWRCTSAGSGRSARSSPWPTRSPSPCSSRSSCARRS